MTIIGDLIHGGSQRPLVTLPGSKNISTGKRRPGLRPGDRNPDNKPKGKPKGKGKR